METEVFTKKWMHKDVCVGVCVCTHAHMYVYTQQNTTKL